MQFNSYAFVIFFAVVLGLHQLPISWRVKKFNLLVASYVFYAAWNPPFVVLIWISTVADWFIAKAMYRATSTHRKKLLLLLTLGVNLGLLGFFKYGGFLLENLSVVLSSLGVEYQPLAPDLILPVGISFYTFQTLSYSLDVYLGRGKPWGSFLDYALYVTFFPQLVAGPIVRGNEFLPQCMAPRSASGTQFGWGLSLLVLGLFQKTVLADGIFAPVVEAVYDGQEAVNFTGAWVGTLAFAGQIFCDFAGYSTCAIGVAMCLGFALPDNFRFPYAAVGFTDFWRRWHISLSSWLRDYLYIPLGGNRHGRVRTYRNLIVTMLLGGLWHGASWTFVVWGALHGLCLVMERAVVRLFGSWAFWRGPAGRLTAGLLTFGLVCVAWVFFRAPDLDHAASICGAMFGFAPRASGIDLDLTDVTIVIVGVVSLLALHWYLRETTLEDAVSRLPSWAVILGIASMLCLIAMMPGEDRAFIYFQF